MRQFDRQQSLLNDVPERKLWCEGLRDYFLLRAGVTLSKDKKQVFKYNPRQLAAGCNVIFAWISAPQALIMKTGLMLQFAVLLGITHLVRFWLPLDGHPELITLNYILPKIAGHSEKLTPFVLGLFISLMIAHTYYANRGFFGTLFGRSIAFAQMVVAWVRPPTPDKKQASMNAQRLLIRWTNAAFRLMVAECKSGVTAELLEEDILKHELLTEAEWAHVKNLPSRCTHIYQWMNNVLMELLEKGFIHKGEGLLRQMHQQIEAMRGANVFGLPSLPMPYTMIITLMVKIHLVLMAMANGCMLNTAKAQYSHEPTFGCICGLHFQLFLSNLLYQGMLDLHGLLYNPNSGEELGHLPVVNFLQFVKTVSNNLCEHNQALPYNLDLEMVGSSRTNSFGPQSRASCDQEESMELTSLSNPMLGT